MALTNLEIKRAQPKEKAYSLSDGLGLALLIEPNGSKGWRFRYRFDNKARLMSFGSYPLVSLSEAREMRDKSRKLVISGVDPMAERRTQKALREQAKAMTFEVVSREWHRSKADRWTLGYRDEIIKTFEQDVFPFIGQRPMGDITPQELLQVLKRIEQRGALEKTRKVRQRCGEVFRYAIITGRAKYNPAPDLAMALATPKKQNYAWLPANEMPYFIRDLEGYTGSLITRNAAKLVMLTGMKMRRPHLVPLSRQVIELLKQLEPITKNFPYIFIGRNSRKKPISKESVNQVIELLGYKGRATGHGFRHTMSTILHEHGFDSAWIETQLAHIDKNSIRGTYNHAQYLEKRREMMQWYADFLGSQKDKFN